LSKNNILLFLFIPILGCNLRGNQNAPSSYTNNSAVFALHGRPIGTMETATWNTEFMTPETRAFNFETCLSDLRFNRKLIHQTISIWDGDRRIATAVSQPDGCIRWSENVRFNFFERSGYVRRHYVLRGEGMALGNVTLPLALNPWLHGEPDKAPVKLVHEVPHVQLNSRGFMTNTKAALWLETLELLDISERHLDGGRLTLKARLRLPTRFRTQDSDGRIADVEIPGGHYRLNFILFSEATGTLGPQREQLSQSVVASAVSLHGKIDTNIEISPTKLPSRGTYKIGLSVTPINAPPGLLPFEGIFELGDVQKMVWSGTRTAQLAPEMYNRATDFKFSSLTLNLEPATVGSTGYYVADELKCSYDGIQSESSTRRTLSYRMVACLARRDGQKLRGGVEVTVLKNRLSSLGMRETAARITNEIGCIDWEDSIEHKYFERERRFLATFQVRNEELGLSEEVPLQINPWDYGWTFCRDARFIEKTEYENLVHSEQLAQSKPPSEYFIDQMRVEEQEVTYEVDDSLNLTVVKTLRLDLFPKVRRPSSQTLGENQVEPLRTGIYLLRFAIVRNHYEDPSRAYQLIDGGEVVVQVVAGRLIKDVPVKLRDLVLVDSRNRMLVELNTIDESKVQKIGPGEFVPRPGFTFRDIIDTKSGLDAKIFDGPLELSDEKTISLYPFDIKRIEKSAQTQLKSKAPLELSDLGDVIQLGRKIDAFYTENQQIAKRSMLEILNLKDGNDLNAASPELERSQLLHLLETRVIPPGTYAALCRYWADSMMPESLDTQKRRQLVSFCRASQGKGVSAFSIFRRMGFEHRPFFVFQDVMLVDNAHFVGMLPPGRNYDLKVSENFSVTAKLDVSAGLKFSPSWKGPLSLGVGVESHAEQENVVNFGTGMSLHIQETHLRLETSKHLRCLVIRVNPEALNFPLAHRPNEFARGLRVCHPPSTEKIRFIENYFYIQSPKPHGYQQDPTDLRNRFYALSVRGHRDMMDFFASGKSSLSVPDSINSNYRGTEQWQQTLDKSFPGAVPAIPGLYLNAVFY